MKIHVIQLLLVISSVSWARKCTKDDIKYKFTECDPRTDKSQVHFYYEKTDMCDPQEREGENGKVTEGSHRLPPYMPDADCKKMCNNDGEISYIDISG